jgi:acyl-CoA synthetase (AMP-forming)/AMP-acid ligase II
LRLIDYFDASAVRHPDRIAFIQPDGERITYSDTRSRTERIAAAIDAAGLSDLGRCAVLSPNDARAFLAMLGIFRAGRVWVPLNARNTVESNAAFMQYTDVECLFFHSDFAAETEILRRKAPNVRRLVCIDGGSALAPSLEEFSATGGVVPDLSEDRLRPCNILATGGTTGQSKGTVWTNLTWETLIANYWTSVPRPDTSPVHLCVAPMTHGAGVLALMLMPEAPTNVLLTTTDAASILKAIEVHRVTHLYLPPTVLYALLASPELARTNVSSLRRFLISAAPVAAEKLKEAMAAFGPVMCQAFGQAEAPFFLTFLSPEDHLQGIADPEGKLLRSCGRPTMFSRVEIMDEEGNLLDPGEVGEIVARSNLVMAGYHKDPAATAEVSKFGWHHTGDIGFKDEGGYVYIVDRKRDMIISGGFNVFTTEVEQAVLSHADVQDCAVIGVPDEKWGEAVKAVVELKPGATVTPEALVAYLRPRLGGVKTPKSVEVWETLPRSPVGKVLKRAIRERYWQGRSRLV